MLIASNLEPYARISTVVKLCSLLVLTLCLLSASLFAQAEANPASVETTSEASVPVTTIKAMPASNAQEVSFSGSVEAIQHADLAVQQAGLIAEILVDVGTEVQKGQALLTLDSRQARYELAELEAAVTSAKASLSEAERQYQEASALAETKVIATSLIAERKSAVAVANAELQQAEASVAAQQVVVAQHTLVAPFSGVITERNTDTGEWAAPQTSVLKLLSNHALRLRIAVPQNYLPVFTEQTNMTVLVSSELSGSTLDIKTKTSANAPQFELAVSKIVPSLNATTRTFPVLIDLPDHAAFVSGMSATARFTLPEISSPTTIWLPRSALKSHPDGGTSIFQVKQGKLERHLVEVVNVDDDRVAIKGVASNEIPVHGDYVAQGVELLQHGQRVHVRDNGVTN